MYDMVERIKKIESKIETQHPSHIPHHKSFEKMSVAKRQVTPKWMLRSCLMALSLLHTYILLTPTATFQKAGTCLEAQQSMAKQPVKGCVSNHSRMC